MHTQYDISFGAYFAVFLQLITKLECGPMPNVMAALLNIACSKFTHNDSIVIPRLHDTTGCQTGCTTGCIV